MRNLHHFLIGIIIGVLQYFLITGLSYLFVIWSIPFSLDIVILILSYCLVAIIAAWNLLYKTHSFRVLFLRSTLSILSFFSVMFGFARLGIISSIENHFSFGSSTQNTQGLICISFCFWIAVVSAFLIIIKCVAFYRAKNEGS